MKDLLTILVLAVLGVVLWLAFRRQPASESAMINVSQTARTEFGGGGGGGMGSPMGSIPFFGSLFG